MTTASISLHAYGVAKPVTGLWLSCRALAEEALAVPCGRFSPVTGRHFGTGIPTVGNTHQHQVAQAVAPESRVVYVDCPGSGHHAVNALLRP